MSITGVKSYSTANIQGDNFSNDTAALNERLIIDEQAIVALQQTTTGLTYNTTGDLTTIDNNLTITTTKKIKCATVPTTNDDVVNKLYTNTSIANLVSSAPATLDTLNELAAALGNDANFATTVATNIGGRASLTANQSISGITTMSNTSNIYYGSGANLTNIKSTSMGISLTNLGANQIVPLLNTSTAAAGDYPMNIGISNNILFNNATGALTVTKYYGDGSTLSNLSAGIILTSLGANQVVPLVNTATATAGNYQLSIGADYSKNILFNNVTGALTATKFNGDGSSLTGIVLPTTALTTNTAQIITSTGSKTFANSSIIMNNGAANSTTIAQNSTGLSIDFTQNYNGGSYNFKTNSSGGVLSTPLTIDSTAVTFSQPPLCSVAPSTANMLCNKTYVDSAISTSGASYVTIGTTQTAIAGQKSFTNASNSYAGSGANLTGVVKTTTDQTIAGNKTFSGNIIMSSGSFNSTIDQNDKYLNLTTNVINNTGFSFLGIIPSQNLQCIVRTDSVDPVPGYAAITGINITGSGEYNAFYNNFFVVGTNASTSDITIQSLTQIQSTQTLTLGTYFTTFIGTRFSLGTYVTADLGLGVYNINQNALVSSAIKATTGTALIALNRPYSINRAVSIITVDYNPLTNIQCPNQDNRMLNAISVKSKSSTSQVDIYGDVKLQGALQYNYGGTISSTTTLSQPLSQFYLITTTAAITITLPTASAALTGTLLIFKRFATSVGATTINQTGGGANIVLHNGLTGVATVSLAATTYSITFICAGVYWFITTITL